MSDKVKKKGTKLPKIRFSRNHEKETRSFKIEMEVPESLSTSQFVKLIIKELLRFL